MDQVEVGQLAVRTSKNKWIARYPVPGLSPFRIRSVTDAERTPGDIKLLTHAEFDRTFVVSSQDPLLMRRMWSTDACQRACDMPLASAEGTIEELELATRNLGAPLVPRAEGLGLLEAIDATDPFGIYAMKALPESKFHPATGPWEHRKRPSVVVSGVIEVMVHPVHIGGVVATAVRAHGSSDRVKHDVDLRTLRIHDTDVGRADMERIGAARFRQQGNHLYLVWYQVVHAITVVSAGISLLRAVLASSSQGPYR